MLHIVPSIGSWERLEQGKPHFGFDTTMPVYLGVIPRRDEVSAGDIRAKKYDLSINRYKETVYQEEQHEPPKGILARMMELEKEIMADMEELLEMLG